MLDLAIIHVRDSPESIEVRLDYRWQLWIAAALQAIDMQRY